MSTCVYHPEYSQLLQVTFENKNKVVQIKLSLILFTAISP